MANLRADVERWLADRPAAVRQLARRFPPGSKYESWHVVGYAERESCADLYVSETNPAVDYDKAVATKFIICADCIDTNSGKVDRCQGAVRGSVDGDAGADQRFAKGGVMTPGDKLLHVLRILSDQTPAEMREARLAQADSIEKLSARIKELECQRDGAFIQGMERAKEIVSRSRFVVGPLNYPCDAVAQAVQCVIDEYKAESVRKAGS